MHRTFFICSAAVLALVIFLSLILTLVLLLIAVLALIVLLILIGIHLSYLLFGMQIYFVRRKTKYTKKEL